MKIALLLLFFALPLAAAKLRGEPELVRQCQGLFDAALPQLVSGRSTATIGTYATLGSLLKAAGAKPPFVSDVDWLLERTYAQNSRHPLIRQLVSMIHNPLAPQILIGVLSAPGRLLSSEGTTHVISPHGPFGIAQVRGVDPLSVEVAPQTHGEPYHFILSDPLRHFQGHAVSWCDRLVCELSQASDTELVYVWLKANMERILKGESPDELFRSYVILKDNRAVVDAGLLATLLLSRAGILAYWLEREADHLTSSEFREANAEMRERVLERLRELGPLTEAVFEDLSLNKENIFEVGIHLGHAMLLTAYPPVTP